MTSLKRILSGLSSTEGNSRRDVMRCLALLLALSATASLRAVQAQEQTPEPSDAAYEFVSGTIAELPAGKIVVNRAVVGKAPELRTFAITSETKIEGKLKTNARVTVGFKAQDEGEPVAMRIIVRPQNQKQ